MKSTSWQVCASSAMTACALLLASPAWAEEEKVDRTLVPYPSEMMPKAASSTLLDITHTGERFIVVGDRGHILVSDDGENWSQVEVPVRAMINRLRMKDANTGWAVGHDGTVLKTSDGGLSWDLLHFDGEWGKPFYDVLFIDDNTGLAVGSNGRMIRTTDGGDSWEDAENPVLDLGLHLNVILQLGDGNLFMAGERSLLARSTDGGENWELLTSPYSGSWFNAFTYGDTGIVAFGLRGNTYATADVNALTAENIDEWDEYGVETQTDPTMLAEMGWTYFENPVIQSLFGGTKYDGENIVLVGVNGTIVKASISEGKFTPVTSDHDAPLSSAVLVDNKLYVVGRNGVDAINW